MRPCVRRLQSGFCAVRGQFVSTDEKTGIQAVQHTYPATPVRAGQVARIEHEYDRHGTLYLIALTLKSPPGEL
jgi:hypothetical protein